MARFQLNLPAPTNNTGAANQLLISSQDRLQQALGGINKTVEDAQAGIVKNNTNALIADIQSKLTPEQALDPKYQQELVGRLSQFAPDQVDRAGVMNALTKQATDVVATQQQRAGVQAQPFVQALNVALVNKDQAGIKAATVGLQGIKGYDSSGVTNTVLGAQNRADELKINQQNANTQETQARTGQFNARTQLMDTESQIAQRNVNTDLSIGKALNEAPTAQQFINHETGEVITVEGKGNSILNNLANRAGGTNVRQAQHLDKTQLSEAIPQAQAALKSATVDQILPFLVGNESGGEHTDPKTGQLITSPKGAKGAGQFLQGTRDEVLKESGFDAYNPNQVTQASKYYLEKQYKRFNGDMSLALAAYNSGAGNVAKANGGKGGIPDIRETQNYVTDIAASYVKSQQGKPGSTTVSSLSQVPEGFSKMPSVADVAKYRSKAAALVNKITSDDEAARLQAAVDNKQATDPAGWVSKVIKEKGDSSAAKTLNAKLKEITLSDLKDGGKRKPVSEWLKPIDQANAMEAVYNRIASDDTLGNLMFEGSTRYGDETLGKMLKDELISRIAAKKQHQQILTRKGLEDLNIEASGLGYTDPRSQALLTGFDNGLAIKPKVKKS